MIVNNPLELLCISTGIPIPKISWMKDGRPLLQNDNIHVIREGLRITSAQVKQLFQSSLKLQTLEKHTELPAGRTILTEVLKPSIKFSSCMYSWRMCFSSLTLTFFNSEKVVVLWVTSDLAFQPLLSIILVHFRVLKLLNLFILFHRKLNNQG